MVVAGTEGGVAPVLAWDLLLALWPSEPLLLRRPTTMDPATIPVPTDTTDQIAMRIMDLDIMDRDIIAPIIGHMDIGNDNGPVYSGPFCNRCASASREGAVATA